jgi:hypothetical protein
MRAPRIQQLALRFLSEKSETIDVEMSICLDENLEHIRLRSEESTRKR